ncbi:MAG: amino acid permease, partial [Cruoricaptor ignavus]|nr:amino acid permease [Cruoricaptor ignavus]
NSKKNLPLAMVLGTFIIMAVYVLYYCGIVYGIESKRILELRDNYITEFSRNMLGKTGAWLIQLFVIISVLGTGNGLLLANIRVPYQFYNLEYSKKFLNLGKLNAKTNTPINSALFAFSIMAVYIYLYYLTNTFSFFTAIDFDLSAVPIAFIYIVNGALFLGLIQLIKNGTFGKKRALKYFMALGAILGVSIVLIGTATSINGLLYIGISLVFFVCGLGLIKKK